VNFRALSGLGLMTLIASAGACDRRYIYLDPTCVDLCSAPDSGSGGTGVSALVAGTAFSCANVASSLYCWGYPPAPVEGFNANDLGAPARAKRVQDLSTSVAAGAGATLCAIELGHVACWGSNETGQLGTTPTLECSPGNCGLQRSIVPGTQGVTALAVSGFHGCAVTADGDVACWGANDSAQLGHMPGDGDEPCASSDVRQCHPAATRVGITDAVEVVTGSDAAGAHGFSCARRRDGSVICWGDNTKGQSSGAGYAIGAGALPDAEPHPVPTTIPGLTASALTAGGLSVCAVEASSRALRCWGDDSAGQGGPQPGVQILDGGTSGAAVPLDQVTSLAHGALHTCAVRLGTVYCLGNNRSKQLGRDEHIAFDAPCIVDGQGDYCSVSASPVPGLLDVVLVGAGGNHTCVAQRNGAIFCWGSNTFQESGHPLDAFGDLNPQRTPVQVQGLP
jgi:alpha-tubulin suppressor-like RCC1 family protein